MDRVVQIAGVVIVTTVVVGVAVCGGGGGLLLLPKFLFRTVVRPKLPDFLLFTVFFLITVLVVVASLMLGSPTSFIFVVAVVVGASGTGVLVVGVLSSSTRVVLAGLHFRCPSSQMDLHSPLRGRTMV